MSTQTQAILVEKVTPTPAQYLDRLWQKCFGQEHPIDDNGRTYIHKDWRVTPGIDEPLANALANASEGRVPAAKINRNGRIAVPNIQPSCTYVLRFQFLDDPDKREIKQRFTYGEENGQQTKYIMFENGRMHFGKMDSDGIRFLDMHPWFIDCPAYWTEKKQVEHGVRVWLERDCEKMFKWIRTESKRAEVVDTTKRDKAQVRMQIIQEYSLAEQGALLKLLAPDEMRNIKPDALDYMLMIDSEIDRNVEKVKKAMIGKFPLLMVVVNHAEKTGVVRVQDNMWEILESGNPLDDSANYNGIGGTEMSASNVEHSDPNVFLANFLFGNSADRQAKPWLVSEIKAKIKTMPGYSETDKRHDDKEAESNEEKAKPKYLHDTEYKAFIAKCLDSGQMVHVKSGVYWGGVVSDPTRVCGVANNDPDREDIPGLVFRKTESRRVKVIEDHAFRYKD